MRLISKILLFICFIYVCYILSPVDKCTVYISCSTGLGDFIFEVFAATTIATLSGCKHVTITTTYTREHGFYNLSRLQSPHFKIINYKSYNWFIRPEFTLPVADKYFGQECGIKGAHWVSSYTKYEYNNVSKAMKEITNNVKIDQCNWKNIGVGVHSRRGDKITKHWSSETALGYNYDEFVNWLVAQKIKTIYLASDDVQWARSYIKRLKKHNIKTHYYSHHSAFDDLCMLSKASIIVRLGTTSTFSAVGSIIGHTNLSLIHPNILDSNSIREFGRTNELDSPWVDSGILKLSVL